MAVTPCPTRSRSIPLKTSESVGGAGADPPGWKPLGRTAGAGSETVKVWPPEVPPPGAGVKTMTLKPPAAPTSLARIVAVSWVAERTLVARLAPLTRRTDEAAKLLPVAVSVKEPVPATVELGLIFVR